MQLELSFGEESDDAEPEHEDVRVANREGVNDAESTSAANHPLNHMNDGDRREGTNPLSSSHVATSTSRRSKRRKRQSANKSSKKRRRYRPIIWSSHGELNDV